MGPLIVNTKGDVSVQTATRGSGDRAEAAETRSRYIYIKIYSYRDGERGNFTKRTVRERESVCGLKVTFRESDALQAAALTTFTREI